MKIEEILETYNDKYADEYNNKFISSDWNLNSINFQLSELKKIIKLDSKWLDVACGTGYVLSQFSEVSGREGLDLSVSMLQKAKEKNKGINFYQRNFLDVNADLTNRYEVITCMWWAYCMVETMQNIRQLIFNFSNWLTDDGVVFLPLCNPQKFDTQNIKIPYIDQNVPGEIKLTSIVWSWKEENGSRHDNVLSPLVPHMKVLFEEFFESVEIIEGNIDEIGEGWRVQDILIAKNKKNKLEIDSILKW